MRIRPPAPPPAAADPAGLTLWQNGLVLPGAQGLYDCSGQPIRASFLQRGSPAAPDFPFADPQPLSPPDGVETWPQAVFLPFSRLNDFGHLLTETAGWLWPFLETQASPLQWADPAMPVLLADDPTEPQAATALAALLGLPAEQVRSTGTLPGPVLCRRVWVPIPSMVNRRWVAPHHFAAVRRLVQRLHGISDASLAASLAAASQGGEGKLYLSRSRLPTTQRQLRGEPLLEQELAGRGWRILHPQELPIAEQLLELAKARVIAAEMGSALHLLMVFGHNMTRKSVIGLGVHGRHRDPRVLNYFHQLQLQPVDFHYLRCLGFHRRRIREGPQPLTVIDRRLLARPQALARRLDRLAAQA